MKLVWKDDRSLGFTRFLATLGNFPCSITEGGAGSVGANVYVGEFSGDVVAISRTFDECETAILRHAARQMSALDSALRSLV